jgi:hypothetical protein
MGFKEITVGWAGGVDEELGRVHGGGVNRG